MKEIVLTGLDGTNPLGFMAALGTLRATTERSRRKGDPLPRLCWRNEGTWLPVLRGLSDEDALVAALVEDLEAWKTEPALDLKYQKSGKESSKLAWDLKPPPDEFRRYLSKLLDHAGPGERRGVDLAAAFGTDVAKDNSGNTKPTALHFTAGQQEFLRMVNELLNGTDKTLPVDAADLREALFGPWTYARPLPVLQWDATTSRGYALRASDPSKEKKLGVPGAEWLAFRSLSFFTTVPRGDRILTTACFGGWKDGGMLWALWSPWLEQSVVATVLALDFRSMDSRERVARGIAIVLESGIRRSDQGGYGSFNPAKVV